MGAYLKSRRDERPQTGVLPPTLIIEFLEATGYVVRLAMMQLLLLHVRAIAPSCRSNRSYMKEQPTQHAKKVPREWSLKEAFTLPA